jgi:hypothetical protein
MPSFETVASGITRHSGAYVEALTVPTGIDRPADGPSRWPDRPCGEAP